MANFKKRPQYLTWYYISQAYAFVKYTQSLYSFRFVHVMIIVTSSNEKRFPRYWPFVQWIHRSSVNSPHKGKWHGDLTISLICAWINGWANNRDVGDLRRHRAHYDVNVMITRSAWCRLPTDLSYDWFMIHETGNNHQSNISERLLTARGCHMVNIGFSTIGCGFIDKTLKATKMRQNFICFRNKIFDGNEYITCITPSTRIMLMVWASQCCVAV